MENGRSPLSLFDPLIARWFAGRMGEPTSVQRRAWPLIAGGSHVLAVAPTGSGKTLTAFLWALDRLITGKWPGGLPRVLYLSPLKALNNDVRKNLLLPLAELKECFSMEGRPFPEIGVLTRSGDTPGGERCRMQRRPPEILITTPESLNILLTSRSGRTLLTGLCCVIMDEIHAVAGTKRGTHLITAVERLTLLSGEFQRVALSATVRPLRTVADFVGGFLGKGAGPRHVEIVSSNDTRRYDLTVSFPPDARETMEDGSWWPSLIRSFIHIVREHRSTLFFANSRRTVERTARLINEQEGGETAYAHHGSLSRELRLSVEERLKSGRLRAIVATSSLELGIDIGELDRVVLVQTPFSLTSAVQRIGRSGHGVGGTSAATIFPTHGRDFIDAAVAARCVAVGEIEEVRPPEAPLDVLAQVLLSMTAAETWDIDRLYAFITTTYSYRSLSRRRFDSVLEMLSGRYADTRIRELRPRVAVDRIDNTVRAREGVDRIVYLSGGTIPDRGYFDLRAQGSREKIGELDEEFVWERRVGESFALGTRVWKITKIGHNDVEAVPVDRAPGIIPFWKAGEGYRDFYFSEKIGLFLEELENRLDDPSPAVELVRKHYLDGPAAEELVSFLKLQKQATGVGLPHRHHLVIEHFSDPNNRLDKKQVILHTLWGGKINQPYALALGAAWQERYGYRLETFADNDCIVLMLPHDFTTGDLLTMVEPGTCEGLLRRVLEQTGLFGARFRENAGRALLLPGTGFGRRVPLWLNRLRAAKILDAVLPLTDFPILLETWRECLNDDFDLATLETLLAEIQAGAIKVSECVTSAASPFAGGLVWKQVNYYMYTDDTPAGGKRSALSDELLREVLSSPLRPRIPRGTARRLEDKLQRTALGYAPAPAEILEWLKERGFIPLTEWDRLLNAMERDHGAEQRQCIHALSAKAAVVALPGASEGAVIALENLPAVCRTFFPAGERPRWEPLEHDTGLRDKIKKSLEKLYSVKPRPNGSEEEGNGGAALLLGRWISFYGPMEKNRVAELTGLEPSYADTLLGDLKDAGHLIIDYLLEGSEVLEVCDRENLEVLLRMLRRERRPSFAPLDIESLPLYMAAWQGLTGRGDSRRDLQEVLDRLFGCPAPAHAWEEYILPARLSPCSGAWLDDLMQQSELMWLGCGKKKITFCFNNEQDLFMEGARAPGAALEVIPSEMGRFSFMECARHSGIPTGPLADRLWELAWKGLVSNDTFHAVRRGALHSFTPYSSERNDPAGTRTAFRRWESTRPMAGNWFIVAKPEDVRDPVDEEELHRERARQLLRRYGVLFRELTARELPFLRWENLFKTLRRMELSGEILSGPFFKGIPGIQFVSHEAFRLLKEPLPEDAVYWMNAADPASMCGVRLAGLKSILPPRRDSTVIVYRGTRPVLFAFKNAANLDFRVQPDDPKITEYLAFLGEYMDRDYNPRFDIRVDRVNGEYAAAGPYADALRSYGFVRQYRSLVLMKKYR